MKGFSASIHRFVLALLAAALLAGCGGAGTASSSRQPSGTSTSVSGPPHAVDACMLVLPADAQAVLGRDPGTPHSSHTQSRGVDSYECDYIAAGLPNSLIVVVKAPMSRASFDSERATYASRFQVQEVAGIGQSAYSFGQASGGLSVGTVNFLQGQYEVGIASYVANAAPADIVTRLTQVAMHSGARLPV